MSWVDYALLFVIIIMIVFIVLVVDDFKMPKILQMGH